MNPVYIRMLLYVLAPLAALAPGVVYSHDAGTLTIDLEVIAMSLPAALAAVTGVFAKWGKK